MAYRVVSYAERPELAEQWDEVVGPAWPQFMFHDAVCNRFWGSLSTDFPGFQIYLVDDESGRMVGQGNSIPFAWDGRPETLPGGVDGVLPLSFEQREKGVAPTAVSALQAVVASHLRGTGLSGVLIRGMAEAASRHGLSDLVAPVRPTWKARYPLIPMERYARWVRDDGLPFDPWMRVHARLGAEILGVCPDSNVIEGTVAEWEAWAGMAFPETGTYVVPGALVPVEIDRERDLGRLAEPNVWMRHPLGATPA